MICATGSTQVIAAVTLFSSRLPAKPLVFVEVVLTAAVPVSITRPLSEDRTPLEAEDAKEAVFYSISNFQAGLAGVGFGNLLNKQVVSELCLSFPKLEHSAPDPDIRAMAARYLLRVKRNDGLPMDAVARFHLGNGAEVHDNHAGADPSANGRIQSSGVMVITCMISP